eukprot:3435254-Pleurochrysis_carterae.AAC.1
MPEKHSKVLRKHSNVMINGKEAGTTEGGERVHTTEGKGAAEEHTTDEVMIQLVSVSEEVCLNNSSQQWIKLESLPTAMDRSEEPLRDLWQSLRAEARARKVCKPKGTEGKRV